MGGRLLKWQVRMGEHGREEAEKWRRGWVVVG
jgi:hypothetical protein